MFALTEASPPPTLAQTGGGKQARGAPRRMGQRVDFRQDSTSISAVNHFQYGWGGCQGDRTGANGGSEVYLVP